MGNTDFKQLVFFWIEKYRNLRNAGFNFGSEYVFSVESVDGTLVVDKVKNEKYMPDFFLSETKKRVRNVSAIIGENGSGKSNLLSALRMVLENRSVPYFRDKARYILIFQTSNGYQCEFNGGFIEKKDWGWLKSGNLKDIATVFYSPTLDGSNYTPDYPSTEFDVSSNVLLSTDHTHVDGIRHNVDDPILFYKHQETWHQIDFIKYTKNKWTNFIKMPTKLQVTTYLAKDVENDRIPVDLNQCLKILTEKFEGKAEELPKPDDFHHSLNNRKYHAEGTKGSLIKMVVLNQLISNLHHCFNFDYPQDNIPLNDIIIQIKPQKIRAEEALKIFLEAFTLRQKNENEKIDLYGAVINLWYKLSLLIDKDPNADHQGSLSASFIVDAEEYGELFELYVNYLHILNQYRRYQNRNKEISSYNFGLIDFDWFELSHGEKAFLNLYSRFNYARELMTEKQQSLKNNVVILIDEGEAGFHLQWQKDYIDNLIKILPKIFTRGNSGDKVQDLNIQIIFTSHSPFSLSDIPNYNITYLESVLNPDGSKICKVLEDKERPQYSFAANIHTLMKHSFYLKNGLVGKFAVLKIEKVIRVC